MNIISFEELFQRTTSVMIPPQNLLSFWAESVQAPQDSKLSNHHARAYWIYENYDSFLTQRSLPMAFYYRLNDRSKLSDLSKNWDKQNSYINENEQDILIDMISKLYGDRYKTLTKRSFLKLPCMYVLWIRGDTRGKSGG